MGDPYNPSVKYLERFRNKMNDELELLVSVDMSVEDLQLAQTAVNVEAVKAVIRAHPERPIFGWCQHRPRDRACPRAVPDRRVK